MLSSPYPSHNTYYGILAVIILYEEFKVTHYS